MLMKLFGDLVPRQSLGTQTPRVAEPHPHGMPRLRLGIRNLSVCSLLFLAATFVAVTAFAKVSPEEAARLEADLTPLGAERAGNTAGTIPPWTGGITAPPPGYEPGAHHPDPYPDDAPLFTITAVNVEEHAAHLSEGQQALLVTYPDTWRMHVYPTRRSASYPPWVYEAAKTNALSAEVIVEGKGGGECDDHLPLSHPAERRRSDLES